MPNKIELESDQGFSLRALVDCGEANKFVCRPSLEDRRHKFDELVVPPMRMKVLFATGESINVTTLAEDFTTR